MKTRISFGKSMRTMLMCVSLSGLMIAGCNKDDNVPNNTPYTVSGNASGAQVVPGVTGTGTGTITGTYNPADSTFTYTSTWSGLSGAPINGGFYQGASGTTGTAVGTPWTFPDGSTGTGTLSGSMTLTSDQAASLTSGGWYYSYGTAAYPGGEIRGQISATR